MIRPIPANLANQHGVDLIVLLRVHMVAEDPIHGRLVP